jgi:Cu(I)/Ag(I) efflux system membrane protein CusA/SilA
VKLPPGYAVLWSGQYEAMARVRARLAYIIPFTLLVVFVLLYLNMRSLVKTAMVLLPCRSRPSAPSGTCTCSATT